MSYKMENYQEEISFVGLHEKNFKQIKDFFKSYKNKNVEKITLDYISGGSEYEKHCKEQGIDFSFDSYYKIPVIHFTIDYVFDSNELDDEDLTEDDLVEANADNRCEVISSIEEELKQFLKYDDYDFIEI